MSPIILDSVVGIVILLSVIFAFFRGFVREMLTIVNLAGAAGGAWFLADPLKPQFDKWLGVKPGEPKEADLFFGIIPPEIMSAFLSYAAPFFGVFLILTLAGLYISGTIKALGLGPVDKALGVAFGAARGFLLAFVVYLPFAYFMEPEDYPAWAKQSMSVAVLEDAYVAGDKYFNKSGAQDVAEGEAPPPDSFAGKWRKMADDMRDKKRETDRAIQKEFEDGNLTKEEVEEYKNAYTSTGGNDYR